MVVLWNVIKLYWLNGFRDFQRILTVYGTLSLAQNTALFLLDGMLSQIGEHDYLALGTILARSILTSLNLLGLTRVGETELDFGRNSIVLKSLLTLFSFLLERFAYFAFLFHFHTLFKPCLGSRPSSRH